MIAADVNKSGTITALDLAAIQSLILGNTQNFPNNTSWRFIPEDFVFTDSTNPFLDNFPESITHTNLMTDELQEDFVAIKIGDINLSATPNVAPNPNTDLAFLIGLPTKTTDGYLELEIKSKNYNNISAWQFDLSFDYDKMDFVGVESLTLQNFDKSNTGNNFLGVGILPMIWIDSSGEEEGLTLEDETVLFKLKFRQKDDSKFSKKWLGINTNRINKSAFKGKQSSNISLLFDTSIQKSKAWQVTPFSPNPFNETTTIEFILPQEAAVQLQIFDLSGKIIFNQEWKIFDEGRNKIELDETFFPSSGVYYYRIRTSQNHAQGKIVFTK